jgi:mannitol 2-dehydrogenase
MAETIQLNADYLDFLPEEVIVPYYEWKKIKTGIVHVGVGNFHRAHQAYYTGLMLNQGSREWGICGVELRE